MRSSGLRRTYGNHISIFFVGSHQNKSTAILVYFFIVFSKHETWVAKVITDFHDKSHKSKERVILLESCKLT